MQNRKEFLKHLLHEKNWTLQDREWLLQYLNENDLTEMKEVAVEMYNADLFTAEMVLERERSELILKNIHKRIKARPVSFVRTAWLHRWKAAAAILVLLAAGLGYFTLLHKPVKQLLVEAGTERKTVKLPDGSMAYLEPGSTLKYTDRFGKEARTVDLTGEAFFDVQQNAEHPFIVASSLINTTVLGTSFNMEARNKKEASVIVLTGMVQVQANDEESNSGQEGIVTANRRAVYNKEMDRLQISDATDEARFYTQKQQGRFIYDGIALINVVNDLQRYYNIPVTVDGRIKQCAFYGDFNTLDDLQKALTLIAVTLNAKITRDSSNNGYIITGGSCH